ncbi:MAG: TldD/PmbA family protein [Candidatus Bathyarchaeia archaeon]|nr:TldD/PmbA family protein [Candidatus Bathyarchaeota archaeon]
MEAPEDKLINLAEFTVNLAIKVGADEAEAFIYNESSIAVNIERGQITRSFSIQDCGVGVRVVSNKALGFAYTNIIGDKTAVEKTIKQAVKIAQVSKPDEEWRGLPIKKPYTSAASPFDDEIARLSSNELVEMASVMLKAAEGRDPRVFPIEGEVRASCIFKAVANSNGICDFDRGTVIECGLATIASEKGEVSPVCFEFNLERSLSVNPEWVGSEAARLASSSLNAKKIETKNKNMKVIFAHEAIQQLFHYTLVNAVKADYAQRSQSVLKDKIGEHVASELITIYDDGLLDGGLRTWKFDGEGVPQQRTPIIERGVLQGFIYDSYTAHKEGKESTGNAFRASYIFTPSVEPTNFKIFSGRKHPEELIGEVDDGLFVYSLQGAHSSNPINGEFSVVATPAWRIKNGEISHAVRGVMLAGNVFEVIKNVSALADNERKIGSIVAPWILVENVRVVGG